jgi:hypothetical protein
MAALHHAAGEPVLESPMDHWAVVLLGARLRRSLPVNAHVPDRR